MILHFNIYPSNSCTCGSIVRFYVSECEPHMIIKIAELARKLLDKSLGTCDLFDWQYTTMQGTFRIIMQRGVDDETTKQAMNDLKQRLVLPISMEK